MRRGPAEVAEDAVAHELGDAPSETRHLASHHVLVFQQNLAHLLRIEPL
jgi:hypothetical protein